ncbi:MAG: hypothetical protein U0746_14400 [Gemmataceae bacterium]
MSALRSFDLTETPLRDDGFKYLRNMPRLAVLTFDSTAVTDAGVAHSYGMQALQALNLRKSVVGDDGLKHLPRIPSLGRV